MEYCVSYHTISSLKSLPVALVKIQSEGNHNHKVVSYYCSQSSSSPIGLSYQVQEFGRKERKRGQALCAAIANESQGFYKDESDESGGVDMPLKPTTSAGSFLWDVLQTQRHIFQFAVAEQLDQLVGERNDAIVLMDKSTGSEKSILYRRIAEMKEQEFQVAIEEVMYMSIVHKFSEIEVPMVPRLSGYISNRVEISLSKCKEFESVHTFEVQEMIKEHLATVIRWKAGSIVNKTNTTQIGRLQLGQIYAASIMYGYFLKSATLRHNLELCMSQIHRGFRLEHGTCSPLTEVDTTHEFKRHTGVGKSINKQANATSLCQDSPRCCKKLKKLRNYVMGFDSETLQRCAKLKSKEAVNLIEKHTWALFGHKEIGVPNADNVIVVTIPSLERLVLEAVTFGSFLWDVERYVDSVYRLKEN